MFSALLNILVKSDPKKVSGFAPNVLAILLVSGGIFTAGATAGVKVTSYLNASSRANDAEAQVTLIAEEAENTIKLLNQQNKLLLEQAELDRNEVNWARDRVANREKVTNELRQTLEGYSHCADLSVPNSVYR